MGIRLRSLAMADGLRLVLDRALRSDTYDHGDGRGPVRRVELTLEEVRELERAIAPPVRSPATRA